MSTDEPTAPDGDGEERELTQEEMVAAEMLRRLMTTPVQDVVFQTMATFTDMAAIRMGLGPRGEEDFDLPQAGLAIESLRALLAVTNAIMGEEAAKPFAEPLAQLQMAFAELVEQAKAARGDAEPARSLFLDLAGIDAWVERWRALDPDATVMDRTNPVHVPRNHLVEEALVAATGGDLAPFERLVEVVSAPYDERPGLERYTEPAPESFGAYRTFCGT